MSLDVGKKTEKVAEDWTAGGNEFQMTDAATGNERRPTVVRRYAGTAYRLTTVGRRSFPVAAPVGASVGHMMRQMLLRRKLTI